MMDLDAIPYVPARWQTPGRISPVQLIVIHDMEAPERLDTAENTAAYFQRIPADRKASAHYCVDADSIVCCVHPMDTAFHAPKANSNGVGIEHAGYASQNTADWLDDYGTRMLDLSAQLTAALCQRYDLPAVYLDSGHLGPGAKGITTHWATTIAYGIAGGHTDPGGQFPMDHYIDRVAFYLGGQPAPSQSEDDDMVIVSNQDGRGEEFVVFGGQITHRWQKAPNSTWTEFVQLGTLPEPVVSIGGFRNQDGRLEVVARAANGHAYRCTQAAPNGTWNAWGAA